MSWYIPVNEQETSEKDPYTREKVDRTSVKLATKLDLQQQKTSKKDAKKKEVDRASTVVIVSPVLILSTSSLVYKSFSLVSCLFTSCTIWFVVTKILLIKCTLVKFISARCVCLSK